MAKTNPPPAKVSKNGSSDMQLLRYAVIGAGSAARTHLRSLTSQPSVQLVGIADPAPRAEWRISKDYDTVPQFSDAEDLFSKLSPDIVSICTPTKFHCDLTLLAFQYGAHVICEKPMAMDLDQAESMERTRIAKQRLGLVNFSYRNLACFRFARHLIRCGWLGPISRISAAYLQSFMRSDEVLWSWRNDIRIAGFGALGDLGVHMIDGVRFVTGLEFRKVVGTVETRIPKKTDRFGIRHKITSDTSSMFLAQLDQNVMAIFDTSQIAPGYGDLFRIEVSGQLGTLIINSEQPDEICRTNCSISSRHASWRTEIPTEAVPPAFRSVGQQPMIPGTLVEAIAGMPIDYPSFADGIAAQKVLEALRQTMKTKAWVTVH
jgi:predicted dehydrogenase